MVTRTTRFAQPHRIYQCYRWQGPCDLMRNASLQDDPDVAVPPSDVNGWTNKPGTLFVDSHDTLESSLDWLWHQMRHITSTVQQAHPTRPTVDIEADLAELKAELLGTEAKCEWMFQFPDKSCFIVAIIAQDRLL